MLDLTTQELFFLKSAVESATIKGTDVRFVAQVLTKIDIQFEEAVKNDQENTPQDIVDSVMNGEVTQTTVPPALPPALSEAPPVLPENISKKKAKKSIPIPA